MKKLNEFQMEAIEGGRVSGGECFALGAFYFVIPVLAYGIISGKYAECWNT